jgi:hypothetical protein
MDYTMTKTKPATLTFQVQVIYGNGNFEDFYVEALTAQEAIEEVRAQVPPVLRRWARFVV